MSDELTVAYMQAKADAAKKYEKRIAELEQDCVTWSNAYDKLTAENEKLEQYMEYYRQGVTFEQANAIIKEHDEAALEGK